MSRAENPQILADTNDEIDLGELFGRLLEGRWWIISMALLGLLLAFVYAQLAMPIYQADALVQVEKKNSSAALALGDVGDLFSQETSSNTEIELLRSRMILGRVVTALKLDLIAEPKRLPVVGNFLKRNNFTRLDLPYTQSYAWHDEAIRVSYLTVPKEMLGQMMTLRTDGRGGYRLYNKSGAHLLSGRVGKTAATADGRLVIGVSYLNGANGRTFQVGRIRQIDAIDQLAAGLRISEKGKSSGILQLTYQTHDAQLAKDIVSNISEQYLVQNVQRLSEEAEKSLDFLNEQIPILEGELTEAENSLNRFRLRNKSVDISLETEAVLQQAVALDAKLSELDFQEVELARRFTRNHPAYSALQDKRAQLADERRQLTKQIGSLPATQQEVLRLTREAKVSQEVYLQLVNKAQELAIVKAGTVGNVRIIDAGVVRDQAIKPKKSLIVALGLIIGGIIGTGIVLLRSFLHQGVRRVEELESLSLPVYACIPHAKEQLSRKKHGSAPTLLALSAPNDLAIEALRSLRTSLHFGKLDGGNNRIVISGPKPGIGKTFVASNLAATVAEGGERVLLIDADMRRGSVHKVLGLRAENGLSEYLCGKINIKQALQSTQVSGLSVLSRGQVPPNPAELLMQPRFGQLMEAMSRHFDTVIIDTAPLLAVTDPALVARHAGMCLMVVRWNECSSKEISLAKSRLEQANLRWSGAVLNDYRQTGVGRYQYGYYQYAYQ